MILNNEKGPYVNCGQRRRWSASAHAQPDQGLRCPLTESMDAFVYVDKQRMSRLDCMDAHAHLDLRIRAFSPVGHHMALRYMRTAKVQISLQIHGVWSDPLLPLTTILRMQYKPPLCQIRICNQILWHLRMSTDLLQYPVTIYLCL